MKITNYFPNSVTTFHSMIKKDLSDIHCPRCGARIESRSSFTIRFDGISVLLQGKLIKMKDELIFSQEKEHVLEGNIAEIKCDDCLFSGCVDDFGQKEENNNSGIILKIGEKWSTIKIKDKTVYVSSECLTRNLVEGNYCEIIGINYITVEDKEKLANVIVRKV